MQQVIHDPSLNDVALATTDLILAIQAEFPGAKIEALPPLSDEEINLKVRLPIPREQLFSAQRRLAALAGLMMDKYGVYSVVLALPLDDSSNSNPT